MEKLLIKLNVGGIVAITSYPGHNEGFAENLILQDQLQTLPSKYFTVASFKMINHSDKAPVFYIIEKVRGWRDMKSIRHTRIKDIIENKVIETQEELA